MIRFTGITWDRNFKTDTEKKFTQAQRYVDSECLRYSDKYTPMQTGTMKRSGTSGTVIGSGELKYTAPYARRQYYTNAGNGKQGASAGGLRGKLWFERMKTNHKDDITKGVKAKFK